MIYRIEILIAIDVTSRGLDIPSVNLVVHYNLPNYTEAFLHRSGRTARAGKSGTVVALVGSKDRNSLS